MNLTNEELSYVNQFKVLLLSKPALAIELSDIDDQLNDMFGRYGFASMIFMMAYKSELSARVHADEAIESMGSNIKDSDLALIGGAQVIINGGLDGFQAVSDALGETHFYKENITKVVELRDKVKHIGDYK